MNKVGKKGFTLVEVLISLIIIGILSGAAMLTFGGGRAKAEATRIVSDMVTLKKAAQMYYLDNESWFGIGDDDLGVFSIDLLQPYMDRDLDEYSFSGHSWGDANDKRYFIYVNQPGNGTFAAKNSRYNAFIAANVTDDYVDYDVRKALEKMAPRCALYKSSYTESSGKDPENYYFKAVEDPTGVISGAGGGMVIRIN